MPIRGVGEELGEHRWIASARWIDGIDADRARLRFTLNYRVTEALQVGIEVNPLDERVGPLANYRLLSETRLRPAILLGTSSDRIGTDSGQAYYATVSKSLEPWLGVPVSPYVGASYNDREHDWLEVAGVNYLVYGRVSVTHLWDGKNLHHTVDYGLDELLEGRDVWGHHTVGLIVAEQDDDYFVGVSYGLRF